MFSYLADICWIKRHKSWKIFIFPNNLFSIFSSSSFPIAYSNRSPFVARAWGWLFTVSIGQSLQLAVVDLIDCCAPAVDTILLLRLLSVIDDYNADRMFERCYLGLDGLIYIFSAKHWSEKTAETEYIYRYLLIMRSKHDRSSGLSAWIVSFLFFCFYLSFKKIASTSDFLDRLEQVDLTLTRQEIDFALRANIHHIWCIFKLPSNTF